MQDKAHPFWKFSLQIFAKPGVDLTCLALQDEYGGDVNLLLAASRSNPPTGKV